MQLQRVLSNKIDSEKLCPGDHIYGYRNMRVYAHHGIFATKDRVIHFTRTEDKLSKFPAFLSSHQKQHCPKCGYYPNLHRGVVMTCLDCFLKGHELHRFDYNVPTLHFIVKRSGTCTTASCSPPYVVLDRAYGMLQTNGFGIYDLSSNNCESFAIHCKTGVRTSQQVFQVKNMVTCPVSILVREYRRVSHDKKVLGNVNQYLHAERINEKDEIEDTKEAAY